MTDRPKTMTVRLGERVYDRLQAFADLHGVGLAPAVALLLALEERSRPPDRSDGGKD